MTIVIPSYQPDERLLALVRSLSGVGYNIIVVDDASGREYRQYFDSLPHNALVLRHAQNFGKGAAIKTALLYISKRYPAETAVLVADCDGQHTPDDIFKVCERQRQSPDSLIIGARGFNGKIPFRSRFGNTVTRLFFRALTGVRVSDTQSGLRAFPASWISWLLECPGSRYEYEMNVLSMCAMRKLPIIEVPIETVYENGENKTSHFRPLRDSVRIYRGLLLFAGASLLSFCVDYLLFLALLACTENMTSYYFSLLFSNVAARIFSGAFNFSLNRWIFSSQAPLLKSAAKYAMLAMGILAANCVILHVLCGLFYIPRSVAKLITEIALFGISYIVQRRFVFRDTPKATAAPVPITNQEGQQS